MSKPDPASTASAGSSAASASREDVSETPKITILPDSTLLTIFSDKKGSDANPLERDILQAFHATLVRSAEASLIEERLQFGATLTLCLSSREAYEYSIKTPSFGASAIRKDLSEFIRAVIEGDEEYLGRVVASHALSSGIAAGGGGSASSALEEKFNHSGLRDSVVDVVCNIAADIYSILEDKEISLWASSNLKNPIEAMGKDDKLSFFGYDGTSRSEERAAAASMPSASMSPSGYDPLKDEGKALAGGRS